MPSIAANALHSRPTCPTRGLNHPLPYLQTRCGCCGTQLVRTSHFFLVSLSLCVALCSLSHRAVDAANALFAAERAAQFPITTPLRQSARVALGVGSDSTHKQGKSRELGGKNVGATTCSSLHYKNLVCCSSDATRDHLSRHLMLWPTHRSAHLEY